MHQKNYSADNAMLTQGVAYLLAKLSLPAMTGMILFSMFSLADTWFVARLGPDYGRITW